jgi:3-isopropylmalate/(R)-2-methylmalate dehydratase large subunit
MAMTATEKILARACGKTEVRAGDTVYPNPELVIVHDGYVASSKAQLDELGISRLFDQKRVVFVTDHAVVYTTPELAARGAAIRKAVKEWDVEKFFDVGQGGIGHLFPMEMGMVLPGSFLFANDMHCTNNGAIGAVAMRTGTEIICVLATGTMWVEVPSTIQITLSGRLQPGVFARDFGYRLARDFTNGTYGIEWDYRVLEFTGDALDHLNLAARVAVCNTVTEIGVANVFFPPNEEIIAYTEKRAQRPFTPVYSDPDADYEAKLAIDLNHLGPQVVLPGSPDQATDIEATVGRKVDHAFIGSCGSGMYDDMVVAAKILKGNRVAAGTRLFIVPGTTNIAGRALEEGLMSVFHAAGAMVLPASCGPCTRGTMAPLTSGEVSISTGTANFAGRYGAKDAEIYLASPATVACSAVTGRITDPRGFGARIN